MNDLQLWPARHRLTVIQRVLALVVLALAGTLVTLLVAAAPVRAAAGDQLFWVATKSPVTNGLYGATAATVPSATNLGSQSGLGRALTTDGTYLYFSDGTNLVRTGIDGTGKTTVVAGVSAPGQIAIAGDYIYYTLYAGGVYGASVASLPATGSQIFTAGSGWNGVAVSGTTIYATNNDGSGVQGTQGLYSATLNGLSPVTATMIDASAVFPTRRASLIYVTGGNLYAAGTNGAIPVLDLTSGTWSSISVALGSIYSVTGVGTTLYFSTGSGLIGSVGVDGTGATALTAVSQFTGSWSVAAAPPPTYTVTNSGNGFTGGAAPVDSSSPYTSGSTVTVLGNTGSLTRTDYQFLQWMNASTAFSSTTQYVPGSTFTISADTTLYARWVGGPIEFRTDPAGAAVTTAAFPATVAGQTSTLILYARNVGAAVTLGTSAINLGVAITSRTCPASGQTLQQYAPPTVTDCTYTLTWTASGDISTRFVLPYGGPSPAGVAVTGTVLSAPRVPIFDTPVPTADGYTINVTNWNGSWGWVPSVSSGSVQAGTPSGSTLPLTVTGLVASASSTVAVTTTRSTYADGSGSAIGAALAAPRVPIFDTPVPTADGYTINVTNWNGSWGWVPSVSSGSVQAGTPSGSTLPLTVTGLAASASSTVTVATTRAGHVDGAGSVLGTAAPAPAPAPAPADTGGSGSSSGDTTPVLTVLLRPHQPLPIQRDGAVQLTLVCVSAKACFISGTIVATSGTAGVRPVVLARFTRIRVPARSRRAIVVRLDAQRLLIVRVSKRGTIAATVVVGDGKGGTRRVPVQLLLPQPESVTG